MDIVDVPVNKIKPYANNPRNNDAAVEAVKQSIAAFGFKVPLVVDKRLTVVCGHTRLRAALALGIEAVTYCS